MPVSVLYVSVNKNLSVLREWQIPWPLGASGSRTVVEIEDDANRFKFPHRGVDGDVVLFGYLFKKQSDSVSV